MKQLEKFRIMVQLALIDNQFEEAEHRFITELAQLNGIPFEALESLIQEELTKKEVNTKFEVPLDFDSKIELLADMIKIMKADGKVYLSEIKFCEMIAKMFGFQEKSISMLSGMIHADPSTAPNWSSLQREMRKLAV